MKTKKPTTRIPLPAKKGKPQTTKKGKRGYDRKRERSNAFLDEA
ncbi:MAG: hypothetical protein WCV85_05890 [Patescibacteria group bacterium]|jgi:hypothetical protein